MTDRLLAKQEFVVEAEETHHSPQRPTIFDKCRETVESNEDIIEMRELEELLRTKGEELKKKLIQLCK